jgi:tRNA threonylcarbamoyladenosine biosynthesis protein TsaE
LKWTGRLTATRRAGLDFISHSPQQTRELGTAVARRLQPGDLVLLSGTLGSGKTTFIQGVASGLGVADNVASPTFTLIAENAATSNGQSVTLFHIDLYRIGDDEEGLYSFGLDEVLEDPDAICAVEWPQRAPSIFPNEWLLIELEAVAETKRRARLFGRGARYESVIEQLRSEAGRGRG